MCTCVHVCLCMIIWKETYLNINNDYFCSLLVSLGKGNLRFYKLLLPFNFYKKLMHLCQQEISQSTLTNIGHALRQKQTGWKNTEENQPELVIKQLQKEKSPNLIHGFQFQLPDGLRVMSQIKKQGGGRKLALQPSGLSQGLQCPHTIWVLARVPIQLPATSLGKQKVVQASLYTYLSHSTWPPGGLSVTSCQLFHT